jgi:hypothetical protein
MPANYGRGHPLVISAGGQESDAYLFDYDAPVIRSIAPVRDLVDASVGARYVATPACLDPSSLGMLCWRRE